MPGLKKIIVFPFFLMLFFPAPGQESVAIGTPNAPLLENIHLHLNKTTFFKGEHLWFKAYIQDQIQQLPSSTTTNLHVGLFSKEGNAVAKKMFLVSKGKCYGDFKIDSTFVEDSYTLMAWTNYMKNFETATPFRQRITILEPARKPATKAQNGMTLLIHPEGQQIVANTFNSLGLMVYDKALRPVQTDAIQLVTEDGTPIQTNIQTNALGQGRFGFFADPTQSYFLKIKDAKGLWITKKLENNLQQGIGISVDNNAEDVIVLRTKGSGLTLNSRGDTRFTLAIFNHNTISFLQDYVFDQDNAAISIQRNEIPNGINTAVILDEEMQPLSQRMFFNKGTSVKRVYSVEVGYCPAKNQDSLQLDLILPKGHTMANISVSVLPAESNAYLPNNAISSSFLVQPYLKQSFVKGRYFFEGTKRSRDYQLDTRLLMEGTEKFNWGLRSIDTQNMPYEKEKHITVNGKILDADTKKEQQVSLMSPSFGTIHLFDLSSSKHFRGNLPLFQGDSVLISVLNYKGQLRKPKAELYFDSNNEGLFDYTKWLRHTNQVVPEPLLLKTDESLDLTDRTIALDEVVVTGNTRPTTFQITTEIEGRIIDKTAINKYRTFVNYIRKLGFQLRPNDRDGGIGVYVLYPPDLYPVPVIIEGMRANPGELMNMPLSSIKTMIFNKFVRPHQGPFISLSLRHDIDALNGSPRFTRLPIPLGFSRVQPYFSPNYPDFNSLLYKKYGAIWWESQLEVDSEVPKSITVPLNGQKAVKVIIEGMSAHGLLYQTEQICSPYQNVPSNNQAQ